MFGNQIVGGGLVLMATGALMGLLRSVPGQVYGWLKRRFSVRLTITDRDPLFEWTQTWLDSLPYAKKTRNVTCSLEHEDESEYGLDSRAVFVPGYGDHFFLHGKKLIWLSRTQEKEPNAQGKSVGSRSRESFQFTVFGSEQTSVRSLIQEIIASQASHGKQRTRAYTSGSGWWRRLPTFSPRRLETVYLPARDEALVTGAIREFLGARAEYAERGIPYHLNFLFEGPPGTGKTSLASALSGHFGLSLHLLNIAGPGMNDERLIDLAISLPRRSILLLEDVDCVAPEREASRRPKSTPSTDGDDEPSGVTLSGLLGCMDGITAPDGAVVIMTTNHPERLDPALLRPGRCDIRLRFGPVCLEQIERMAARLLPGQSLDGDAAAMVEAGRSAAEVQAELLSRISKRETD